MAAAYVGPLRLVAILIVVAALAWVGWETAHAGADIPAQRTQQQTQLSSGSANDKRIDGKSWSLDYDNATLSPDGSLAEIDHVHHGVILRNGKPYMHMTAKHVSANLSLNDFVVTGPVEFTEIGGQRRQLDTDQAHYSGNDHMLHLDHPVTIRASGMTFHVQSALVNFTTGNTKMGRIKGSL